MNPTAELKYIVEADQVANSDVQNIDEPVVHEADPYANIGWAGCTIA
ncbi:hypothetical protein MSPP1_000548a [Malassezia sp. CBS 17886]|nr:hypothetical protein MSPP1_000548a [Malassezia sp. CBS 17886]